MNRSIDAIVEGLFCESLYLFMTVKTARPLCEEAPRLGQKKAAKECDEVLIYGELKLLFGKYLGW